MEKFSTQLKKVMFEKNMRAAELSRLTGISKTTLSDYINDVYEPKSDKLLKIAKVLNVDPVWLMGYQPNNETKESGIKANQFYLKYYISNLSAGSFHELIEFKDDEHLVPIPKKYKAIDKRVHCFKINGTSMNNVIPDNSIVVTVDNNNNAETYKNGDIVVVFYNNEATVKRFYDEGDYIILKPDSNDPTHEMIFIQKNIHEFYIVGRVVWLLYPDDIEFMFRGQ